MKKTLAILVGLVLLSAMPALADPPPQVPNTIGSVAPFSPVCVAGFISQTARNILQMDDFAAHAQGLQVLPDLAMAPGQPADLWLLVEGVSASAPTYRIDRLRQFGTFGSVAFVQPLIGVPLHVTSQTFQDQGFPITLSDGTQGWFRVQYFSANAVPPSGSDPSMCLAPSMCKMWGGSQSPPPQYAPATIKPLLKTASVLMGGAAAGAAAAAKAFPQIAAPANTLAVLLAGAGAITSRMTLDPPDYSYHQFEQFTLPPYSTFSTANGMTQARADALNAWASASATFLGWMNVVNKSYDRADGAWTALKNGLDPDAETWALQQIANAQAALDQADAAKAAELTARQNVFAAFPAGSGYQVSGTLSITEARALAASATNVTPVYFNPMVIYNLTRPVSGEWPQMLTSPTARSAEATWTPALATDLCAGYDPCGVSQTITFAQPPAKTYGDADFTVSASASSGLPVSFTAGGTCTVSGSTVHITGAGTCTVTASQAGNQNYVAAPNVVRSITVAKKTPTLTANTPAHQVVNTPITVTFTVGPLAVVPNGTVVTFTWAKACCPNIGETLTAPTVNGVATFSYPDTPVLYAGTINYSASTAATANLNAGSTSGSFTIYLY